MIEKSNLSVVGSNTYYFVDKSSILKQNKTKTKPPHTKNPNMPFFPVWTDTIMPKLSHIIFPS